MRCCVKNCNNDTNTTKNQETTYHPFPDDADIFKTWIEALGLTDWEAKTKAVCSEHFRNEDFYVNSKGHIKIKRNAIPMDNDITYLDEPATFKVCRICLSMGSKMFKLTEGRLEDKFRLLTGINLCLERPRQVCWECAARLCACAAFRDKAVRADRAISALINSGRLMTIRDAKTISRSQALKTSLISNYFEPIDSGVQYVDNEVLVKRERQLSKEIEREAKEETQIPQIIEVEVKDETANGIFFDEFDHFSDSDDDKTLSEVVSKPKKEKKKNVKKKEKPLKNVKAVKRKNDEENPSSTMEKYKTSDVKRRRTQDALDESLFTITTMSYEEQIAEIQKRQESVKYTAAPYKCTACFRGFLTKDRYDVHIIRHTDQSGAYECFICKSRMKSARALRKHLTGQHTEKFSCKGCPFITRNRGVAREHEKWHNGTKYQCPHCPTEFDKLTTYLGHIRIKHVSDFVCELCGYTFVSEKGIEVHKKKKHRLNEKNVTLEGPYCEVCDVKFVSEDAHARHLKLSSRHSSDSDPNRIRNDSQSMNSERKGRCSRQMERRPVIHRERHPSRDSGPVTCEQCGSVLRDLRLYAQHFRRAHPDKNRTKYPAMKTPCMCEQCGRIFQSMCLLKDHMWVHTGEKRFKCDRCDKSFTQKTNLVFHMRVHSATRPSYECPLCGKHFAFYNNRRRHMFIHTGLKPFKCDTCGKCFTTSGEHRAHVEHVHMKKPWPKRARHRGQDWKCADHMED